eukprot:scaffold249323_cov36-Cyclotella_meneghiniana.AAC.6
MEEGDKSKWAWGGSKDLDLETLQEMNIQSSSKLRDEDLEEFLPAKKRKSLSYVTWVPKDDPTQERNTEITLAAPKEHRGNV